MIAEDGTWNVPATFRLSQQFGDHAGGFNAGQSQVKALVLESETFVVDP